MAITGKQVINGQEVPNAYAIIVSVQMQSQYLAVALLAFYSSQADYANGKAPIAQETKSLTYDGKSALWDSLEDEAIDSYYRDFTRVDTVAVVQPEMPVRTPEMFGTGATTSEDASSSDPETEAAAGEEETKSEEASATE